MLRYKLRKATIVKFWSLIDIRSKEECWPWLRSNGENKYGKFVAPEYGKVFQAHRLAYLLVKGKLSKSLQIRHTCDWKPCCNPEHLIKGTQLDNARDAVERGRYKIGENNGAAKLAGVSVVKRIRELYATGKYSHRQLAKRFGLVRNAIKGIVTGKTWKHAGGPIVSIRRPKDPAKHSKLTFAQVLNIRQRVAAGESQASLAREYGVVRNAIFMIVTNQCYKFIGGPIRITKIIKRKEY